MKLLLNKEKNRKTITDIQFNKETKKWENYSLNSVSYLRDELIEEDAFYFWNKETQSWEKNSQQKYFYDEKNQIIRKQDWNINNKETQFSYAFDKNGNNVEVLIEEFDSQNKLWQPIRKIEYSYDVSIAKQEVSDLGKIGYESVNSNNPLLEKKDFLYKNGKWKLVEHLEYFYNKK